MRRKLRIGVPQNVMFLKLATFKSYDSIFSNLLPLSALIAMKIFWKKEWNQLTQKWVQNFLFIKIKLNQIDNTMFLTATIPTLRQMNWLLQCNKKNQQGKFGKSWSLPYRDETKVFVIGLSGNEERSLQTIRYNLYCR